MRDPKIIADLERQLENAARTIPHVVQSEDQQAFQIGVSFHLAAMRCGEVRVIDGTSVMATSPMIVNYAFAIELYLKSLLIASNGARRGHNLEELFRRLRDADREEIERRYEALGGRTPTQLAGDLASYARAFEEWRYIFETKRRIAIAAYSLYDLARACFFVIGERNPSWGSKATRGIISQAPDDESIAFISLGGGAMLRARPPKKGGA
ncbi:HEPN domain-containing protein [Mesorhizobium sp.]|uniref:HEPN domain-containing protein n=1 Tax=Mesorhizobium sp. TaxID=1871066 RepID=UPI000FE63C61|nr:HEPN domain-containing protein [Mesorhizobium sp.]RWG07346.1 MAG: HEPN domain-containing protein [Mesorhizobium sp.]RWH03737.1 MAG: HEPN domain-containing protein [Mesorhizobium sp.]TIN43839.1 MAG: HEPN domain-containing protein [Mesorhizobium sp.]TIR93792.1 MAG: HEPN domain-containing protein [Mesorhizobium sp.]TIS02844.1 MAG: HEPN domain-containing protein [Mesorhizobium sp.]